MALVCLSRFEQCGRPLRLVGRVGIVLRLEANGSVFVVLLAILARYRAVEEVAGVNLYARLVGVDVELNAGGGAVNACRDGLVVALSVIVGVETPDVVNAFTVLKLYVV